MFVRGPEVEASGAWALNLVLSAIGLDGLVLVIYFRHRASADVAVPVLIGWQIVVLVYFFRTLLPAVGALSREHADLTKLFAPLFRLAMIGPTVIALIVAAVISALAHG